MRLDRYTSGGFDRGAPRWKEALWLVANGLLLSSWLPGSGWRRGLLAAFGATLGRGVVVKPGVRVKFPWRLAVGDHTWIGEDVWIDNLADVIIGDHVCVSQGSYLCTGSHDWSSENFDLILKSIILGSHAWIGAKTIVAPGCKAGEGSITTLGSVISGRLDPWTIYSGAPAKPIRKRFR